MTSSTNLFGIFKGHQDLIKMLKSDRLNTWQFSEKHKSYYKNLVNIEMIKTVIEDHKTRGFNHGIN